MVQVAELKVPLKITPLGTPPLPFPVMVKVPPAARVPPFCASPLVKAPVVKLTDPKFAPTIVSNLNMVEPVRDKPLALPESVPPALEMSMLLARAVNGRASARTASHTIFLYIMDRLLRKAPNRELFFNEAHTLFWTTSKRIFHPQIWREKGDTRTAEGGYGQLCTREIP
jgi:hypothetical protein